MNPSSGVEILLSSGAWHDGATILDYTSDSETPTVRVYFDNDPAKTKDVPIQTIRFSCVDSSKGPFVTGDQVELVVGDRKSEWYLGRIVNCKGEYFVCEYNEHGQLKKEVVEFSELRHPNKNKCMSKDDIHKSEIELPEELHEYCQYNLDAHREFQKSCEAMSVRYLNGKLIVLSRADVSSRVEMLQEFHIKALQHRMKLSERVNDLTKSLEQSKMVAESNCEKFTVDKDLMKFLFGAKGVNIAKARQIPGVIHIEVDDQTNSVSIYAETPEAAKEARQMLEYTEEHFLVPKRLVGQIIGQRGKSIQDIVDKSQVLKIQVLSVDDSKHIKGGDDPSQTVFKFIGTRSNNANARALMHYLVESLLAIESLQDVTYQIEDQIKTYRVGGSVLYSKGISNGNQVFHTNGDSKKESTTKNEAISKKEPTFKKKPTIKAESSMKADQTNNRNRHKSRNEHIGNGDARCNDKMNQSQEPITAKPSNTSLETKDEPATYMDALKNKR